MLIFCKFINTKGDVNGGNYSWKTDDNLEIGETVQGQNGESLFVTKINITEKEANCPIDKLKSVFKINKTVIETPKTVIEEPETVAETEPIEATAVEVVQLPDVVIDEERLVIVEQLPIITEQLKSLVPLIQNKIDTALSMDCTDANKTIIKKYRSDLNKLNKKLTEKVTSVKKEVNKPLEDFLNEFKSIQLRFSTADTELKNRIEKVEKVVKQNLEDETEAYFYEYAASEGINIDWIKFEKMGLSVGVSDNKTALRREVKLFLDKIADELKLIDTQPNKAEILVEYKKSLKAADAISIVQARIKAVEAQKVLEAEREAKRLANIEARRVQAEALEKARAEALKIQPVLEMPKPVASPTVVVEEKPVAPPITQPSLVAPVAPVTQTEETMYSVTFSVTGTKEKLMELSKFLKTNNYNYEKIKKQGE